MEQSNIVESLKQIPQTINDQVSNLQENVLNIKEQVTDSLQNFSNKNEMPEANNSFLQSNSVVAKFAFFVLVLIFFMVFLNIGVGVIAYFLKPSKNPYIVKGMINGNHAMIVQQNPKNKDAAPIFRSNNKDSGLEFTWTVWLFITSPTNDKYQHIFNKGNAVYGNDGLATVNNGPGLYVKTNTTNTLHVVMDTVSNSSQSLDVSNIPFNNWFHLAMRMKNNILDVYVNGTIGNRMFMNNVAKQNYYDVNICQNGGFSGSLSNLRYYDSALSSFSINNIVMFGPNKSANIQKSENKNYNYLSTSWYTANY